MSPDIYVMDAQGRNIRNLTRTAGVSETDPAWSPDGTQIAYSVQNPARSMNADIYVIDVDGGNRRRVANFKDKYPFYLAWEPSWSSDSQYILFTLLHIGGENEDGMDLCMINRDGKGFRVIYHKRGIRAGCPKLFGNVLGISPFNLKGTLWGVIKRGE